MGETDISRATKQLEHPGVLKRLYDYAYQYDSYTGKRLPPDWTPQDIVHEAISKLLAGERSWDSGKFPDVVPVIQGIIKSLFSHLPELKQYQLRSHPRDEDGNPLDVDELPVGHAAEQLEEIDHLEVRKRIESAIGEDEELMSVYFAIVDGYTKPREIADELGIAVEEVNNRLRRLRRKCHQNAGVEV